MNLKLFHSFPAKKWIYLATWDALVVHSFDRCQTNPELVQKGQPGWVSLTYISCSLTFPKWKIYYFLRKKYNVDIVNSGGKPTLCHHPCRRRNVTVSWGWCHNKKSKKAISSTFTHLPFTNKKKIKKIETFLIRKGLIINREKNSNMILYDLAKYITCSSYVHL